MNLQTAKMYADDVVELLRPSCERIEIAGGIRRGKLDPHDIELVAIPKMVDHTGELVLGTLQGDVPLPLKPTNELHYNVLRLVRQKVFGLGDPDKNGRKAPFSEKYYRIKYQGEQLDLFAVLPGGASWGVIFTLRTGDANFSHWLVMQGWKKGIYVRDGQVVQHLDKQGVPIAEGTRPHFEDADFCVWVTLPTPEEIDVFKALGVEWVEPEKRIR